MDGFNIGLTSLLLMSYFTGDLMGIRYGRHLAGWCMMAPQEMDRWPVSFRYS